MAENAGVNMQSTIRPDLHVPDEFAARMDEFADICDALIVACREVTSGSGDLPDPASQIAQESEVFRSAHTDAPANIEYGPAQGATTYADSIRLQLASISALLRAREVVGSLWPIVRAELEIAGRVAWLLEPTVEQPAAEARIARYYLEIISSLQRQRFTTSKYDSSVGKYFKAQRDATMATAKSLFPDLAFDLSSPERISGWALHGELMVGLGAGANLFARHFMTGPGSALYDILSDYSHPSLVSIELQTRLVDDGEVSSRPWVISQEDVEHVCRWACIILYKTCDLICGYLGMDASPLERWADSAPERWFSQPV
jgi:hypothetical protein